MHIAMNAPTSVMSRSDARSNGSLNHGEPGRDAHQRSRKHEKQNTTTHITGIMARSITGGLCIP